MKVSIKFSLASSGKASDLPIRIRVSYDGERLELRSGYVCPPECWDAATMRMKSGTRNRYRETAAAVNRELSKQETIISEILARCELDNETPKPALVKQRFLARLGKAAKDPDAAVTLGKAIERYMEDAAVNLTGNTLRTYGNTLTRVKMADIAKVDLNDLTSSDLSAFLIDMWEDELENQSASSYLARVKTVLRYAKQKGWYDGSLYETFRPKFKGLGRKDVYYLEWNEFKQLLYVQLPSPLRVAVRDAFCFCCATGLRQSDAAALRWSNVHLTCEVPHISLVAKKTTKPTIIELNQFARAIIDRQLPNAELPDGLVFPEVNLRTRNIELPIIAKAAGIKGQVRELSFCGNKVEERMVNKADAISTHWGRHTFIVHALSLGISPTVVMQWTGHASYESMKPYIAIADTAKAANMELFNK